MRKHYLDNIRWITIILVLIYHVFFYYNNIGIAPMFDGLVEYTGQKSIAGIFQYLVYPWFMLLLFVVSGVSARITLTKRDTKTFYKSRVDKLLVPSTLGILGFGWVGGYIIWLHSASVNFPENTPKFVAAIVAITSGIGALWFCHVLFLGVLLLILVRWILRKAGKDDETVCNWFAKKANSTAGFICMLVIMYFITWGSAHVLNMPVITTYRLGYYIVAFFMGFYIFSSDAFIEKCKSVVIPMGILSLAAFLFYLFKNYGTYYAEQTVMCQWDFNLFAFCMVVFVFGITAKYLDKTNTFMTFMSKKSFGIYVFHIPVMLVTNYFLTDSQLPLTVIYFIEFVVALPVSLALNEIISRIPILRYWILGIRK